MNAISRTALFGLIVAGAGCAVQRPVARHGGATMPSTQPRMGGGVEQSSINRLQVDQIEPAVALPSPAPTTGPTTAPLDALELFAKARDAQLNNQRYTAINLLEKALQSDPDSVELNIALGKAYLSAGAAQERGIAAFEKARQLDPSNIEIYVELARAYQAHNDAPKAVNRLRLARLTPGYHKNDPLAAVVDYRLGVALQQQGYDRAAIDCYQSLLERLQHGAGDYRLVPEINFLLARPEPLYDEMAKLYEKLGDLPQALEAYQTVAEHAPNDFDLQARVVRTLAKMHRDRDADAAAAALVRKFHASSESLSVLREVYHDTSSGKAFAQTLRKLHEENPGDRALLFAYADALSRIGQAQEARRTLAAEVEQFHGDVEIIQRAWQLEVDQGRLMAAAELIIRSTARYPQNASELAPLFTQLLGASRAGAVRLSMIQSLALPPDVETSRQFWLWQGAALLQRTVLAETSLQKAATAETPFAPACRKYLQTLMQKARTPAERQAAAEQYIATISGRGRQDLVAELRGVAALQTEHFTEAVDFFTEAMRQQNPPTADVQLELAVAYLDVGNGPRFEQGMWRLISDHPRYDQAYQVLINYYRPNDAAGQVAGVVEKWLAAIPDSPAAQLAQITGLIEQGRADEAATKTLRLFQQYPDDSQVVAATIAMFDGVNQRGRAVELLEAERVKHPTNVVAVEALVELYKATNDNAAAQTALDAARAAVSKDPDLLYFIAHLYQRIGQNDLSEQVLLQVMTLDPQDAQAGNDLGYTWADEGKNLDRAEKFIRVAVTAEPDNSAYRDSLGWVLYKRGMFADAGTQLEKATEPTELADPVVLDHLGDTLYRLDRQQDAVKAWQQSLKRLGENQQDRDDTKGLDLKLHQKIQQISSRKPASVAPTASEPEQMPSKTPTTLAEPAGPFDAATEK